MSVFYTVNLERNMKPRENKYGGKQEICCHVLYYTEMQTYTCDGIKLDWALGCDGPVLFMRDLTGSKVSIFVSSIITSRVCFTFTNYKLHS